MAFPRKSARPGVYPIKEFEFKKIINIILKFLDGVLLNLDYTSVLLSSKCNAKELEFKTSLTFL